MSDGSTDEKQANRSDPGAHGAPYVGEAPPDPIDPRDIETTLRVLGAMVEDPRRVSWLPDETRVELLRRAGVVSRPSREQKKKLAKTIRRVRREEKRAHDVAILDGAGNRTQRRASGHVLVASTARDNANALALPPAAAQEAPPASAIPVDEAAAGSTAPSTSPAPLLKRPRSCYVCKSEYREVHHFYDSLCPPCAALNYTKRFQTANLDGRVALVTGARIKIGYQAALMLLRAGARVIVTTRFPVDAARRFAAEPDFARWSERLSLHGLDLRHLPSVELFARRMAETLPRLDVLVNNAAQTVRRPPLYYTEIARAEEDPAVFTDGKTAPLLADHVRLVRELGAPTLLGAGGQVALAAGTSSTVGGGHGTEASATGALLRSDEPVLRLAGTASLGIVASAQLSQAHLAPEDALATASEFPPGVHDLDAQQMDLRAMNSWRLKLGEVPTAEVVEVHLVNAVAPFVLLSHLRPLLEAGRTDEKHVINVSAMEAQFSRNKKTDKHPHTNMAKASLNMMTRTSAPDFADHGIWMNSVDTGWVTDEDPLRHVARKQVVHDFHPPLDAIDGAARVLDPLFDGLNSGRHAYGMFFKDYRAAAW